MRTPPSDPTANSGSERRALVVGVLGGIASGKSLVARLLAGDDGAVVDADRVAHAVLASDAVTRKVRERFGDAVLGVDGRPDRRALAQVVFEDSEARAALEGWIHPLVRDRIRTALDAARTASIVVLDVPLLLENDREHGLRAACDVLVHVDAPVEQRTARAVTERGWAPDELARRERAQLPQDEKRRAAQHVIVNDGDLDQLKSRCADLRRHLLAQRPTS
ncbi:Dephospho-CoA kinase [Planctomycetes bacterium Pla163]|uniref:Dephospho-CoA kinase n=1 Tax=Rohdeia mirabilis TaxID=2528008 RepID=A0A518CYU3_9BACT|nr:Dephospho-CoA kinase [Planctomycetes bacterium Pla163]